MTPMSMAAREVENQGGASKSTLMSARPLRISLSRTRAISSGSICAITGLSMIQLVGLAAFTLAQAST